MKTTVAKKISLYGLLTTAALLFGYVEYLVPFNFIAPGVKLGVSNCIVLLLVIKNKYKSALAVNVVRIILSVLLFAAPFSIIFSLTAGVISTIIMILLSKLKNIGVVGISALGGCSHNLTQIFVAYITVGDGVIFYLPFLLIIGILSGVLIGILVWIILKRINNIKLLDNIL